MNTKSILCAGAAFARPWSVWADDQCLARSATEPTESRLQRLADDANRRGWNGTTMEVHLNGSWQRDFAPDCEAFKS